VVCGYGLPCSQPRRETTQCRPLISATVASQSLRSLRVDESPRLPRLASLRCASLGAARAALGSAATVHRTNASTRLRRPPASLARFPARRQAGAPRRGLGAFWWVLTEHHQAFSNTVQHGRPASLLSPASLTPVGLTPPGSRKFFFSWVHRGLNRVFRLVLVFPKLLTKDQRWSTPGDGKPGVLDFRPTGGDHESSTSPAFTPEPQSVRGVTFVAGSTGSRRGRPEE
jgi:hypothetical protein